MIRLSFTVLFLLLTTQFLSARVLTVGSGGYSGLESAAADAQPGDTIMFAAGTHAGGAAVSDLHGTAQQSITIMGAPNETVLIEGGVNAFQLSDVSYLRITNLQFDGQTGNGVNIDDGGSFDTPSMYISIDNCHWLGIGATGNNDQLKMSGVDNFTVRNCSFRDGAAGGSMIDMVGCHYGEFAGNRFENAGSNCIQAKGGTRYISITRNLFLGGGQRAINIGGSTGLPYFRPQNADYEAQEISVIANIFTGAIAPVAFVGAVRCEVVNNTMFLPEKWAVRILQETTDSRFQQCGENILSNNLFYIDAAAAAPSFNIGPNTRPLTFLIMNNLWYNADDENWQGPNTPVTDMHMILNQDPLLTAPALRGGNFTPASGSPAIGAGSGLTRDVLDFNGHLFRDPQTIGAIEADTTTNALRTLAPPASFQLTTWPNPSHGQLHVRISDMRTGGQLRIHDIQGKRVPQTERWIDAQSAGSEEVTLSLNNSPAGWYFLIVESAGGLRVQPFLLQK
ncbi:right-handed parallel beta-helix repeat-containing protein [bacterium]|nr:right-handed parallel beta-helix repeat-containing protein [bacterium]